jgi:hypothetical protein
MPVEEFVTGSIQGSEQFFDKMACHSMQASAALLAAVHWKFQSGTMNPDEGQSGVHVI